MELPIGTDRDVFYCILFVYMWCYFTRFYAVMYVLCFYMHVVLLSENDEIKLINQSTINQITDVTVITLVSFKLMLVYYGFRIIGYPEILYSVPFQKDIYMKCQGYFMPSPYIQMRMCPCDTYA